MYGVHGGKFLFGLGERFLVMEVRQNRIVLIVRSRLAQVVKACPDELSKARRILVLKLPLLLWSLPPIYSVDVVGADMKVFLRGLDVFSYREIIHSPGADGRGGLAAEIQFPRIGFVELLIEVRLIVEAVDIHCVAELLL